MGVILQIILWILKLLGILLLVVLGVLLLVLVVPIRYELHGEADAEKKAVNGRVTWLLRALSVRFGYGGEFSYSVKVLGITIMPRKSDGAAGLSDETKAVPPELVVPEPEFTGPETGPTPIQDPVDEIARSMPRPEPRPETTQGEASPPAEDEKAEKKTEKARAKKVVSELPPEEKLKEKLTALWNKFQEIKAMILDKGNQAAVKLVLSQVWRIVKHIMPRSLRAKGVFGFDDPSTTGQVTGVLAVLMPIYEDAIQVMPDFEQKRLEGEVHLKGHIRLGIFVVVVVRLIIDKHVRGLIKQVLAMLKPNKGGRKNGRKQ